MLKEKTTSAGFHCAKSLQIQIPQTNYEQALIVIQSLHTSSWHSDVVYQYRPLFYWTMLWCNNI